MLAEPHPDCGGEEHQLEPDMFARVGPGEKRKIVTGDERARVIALGGDARPGLRGQEFTTPAGRD